MPDDTQVPPDAAVDEQRAVPDGAAEPGAAGGGGEPEKLATLQAQLEESFKRTFTGWGADDWKRFEETFQKSL